MTLKTTQLRDAIKFALWIAAASLTGTGLAMAQQATPPTTDQAPTELDRMVVTGTRIAIPGLVSTSPVLTVERVAIEQKQSLTVEEFTKQLSVAAPSIGPGTNNGSGGGATIDLRGLGANRTLVLIDGRRIVPFDLNSVVDTNVIPVALIERVDVLTGGASAVYGADAVAGVINFILKRNFEGLEISSSYGQSASDADAARYHTDVTLGASLDDGRGNVVLSVGRTKTDPLLQGARAFGLTSLSSTTGRPQGSGTTVPTRIFGENRLQGQINPATGRFELPVTTFNFNPLNYFVTPLDRYQATALGTFDVTDKIEAYAQMLYTRSNVGVQLAPSGTFFEQFLMPIGNPFLPQPARLQICADSGIAPAACVEGNPTLVDLTIARRFVELGPRIMDFSNKSFQTTVGARGNLTDTWRYDAYWSHGESDQLQTRENWGSLSKTRQALMAVDRTQCIDPSNGCVPLNLWGAAGSITPAMINFFNLDAFLTSAVQQDVLAGFVSGDFGDRFKSPWSPYPIGAALGLERREMSAASKSDAASQILGEVLGTGAPSPDLDGTLLLEEAYGEVLLPLVNDKPFIYALSLEAGYRHTKFTTIDSTDYGSWKYGGEWAPIESLRFRGMFQRATRAPNVGELFFPLVTGLDNLAVDPCEGTNINLAAANTPGTLSNLCRQTGVPVSRIGTLPAPSAGQINILTGGNPRLGPETGDTQTLGLVWQPTFVNDLSFTFDYWKIEMEDLVSSPSSTDVLDDCYSTTRNPSRTFNAACAAVGRSPITGTFNGSTAPGVALPLSNLGTLKTDGFDLGIRYGFDLADTWGRLDFGLDATKVRSSQFQATPTSVNRDCLGFYSIACGGPSPEFKSNFRTTWSINDFAATLFWRHIGDVQEEPGGGVFLPAFSKIDAFDYFDLALQYQVMSNMRLNLTVNNLTDKQPPVVGNTIAGTGPNSGNTFPQDYDVIGRYFTVGVTLKF